MSQAKVKFPFSADVLLDFFNVKYCIFTSMTPRLFLDAAVERTGDLYRNAVDDYKEKIVNGEHVASLYLLIKGDKVVGHEGRHRAQAALELGVHDLPVSVEIYQTYLYNGYEEMRAIDAAFGKGTSRWLEIVGKYQLERMIFPPMFSKHGNFISTVVEKQVETYSKCDGKPMQLKMRINDFGGLFNILASCKE